MRNRTAAIAGAVAAGWCCLFGAPLHGQPAWTVGSDVYVRHDDNVGNARLPADVTSDTSIAAQLSLADRMSFEDGLAAVGGSTSAVNASTACRA